MDEIKIKDEGSTVLESTIIGAIFCHVARRIHMGQLRPAMTCGSQKWKGARPSLIISPVIIISDVAFRASE